MLRIMPATKTHGGKFYLANPIIGHFPPRVDIYVEPFVGGGSVFLSAPPSLVASEKSCLSDLNPLRVAVLLAIRDHCEQLQTLLGTYKYAEQDFKAAADRVENDWKHREFTWLSQHRGVLVGVAADAIAANRMSRGGLGKAFAWSERLRGGQPGDVNAWQSNIRNLPRISQRLRGTRIRCDDAINMIVAANIAAKASGRRATLYLDPPYHPDTRSAKRAYDEFDTDHAFHLRLAQTILGNSDHCNIILSGYDCKWYQEWYRGWRVAKFDVANNSGQGKTKARRIETIWMNY